jgi:Xaa-Pro aminopeptidase
MQTMHPTLLVGPADWDPRRMPRVEFEERLTALWESYPNAGGAIVYGNSSDYAALAYLTSFTPKLEAALALVPRQGEAQLLIGGGVNMVPAAKPLTFVETLAPLREAAKTAGAWARALQGGGSLLLIGGDAMPLGMRRAFDQALDSDIKVEVADQTLRAGMRRKRPRELRAMREACNMLAAAAAALRDAVLARKNVTDCILTAEHAALKRGAQDVRSLFSLDGGYTLRPFDLPIPERRDPLQTYLALRHDGYWAEGFVRIAATNHALQEKVDGILDAMVASAKPGLSCQELRRIVDQGRGALRLHPLAATVLGGAIGLALDEPPALTPDSNTKLEAGAVYSLRAGLIDDTGAGVVASAVVVVTPNGPDVLWRHGASS